MGVYGIKIGGPAGFGIMTAGPMLAKILKRRGYYVHGYPEYPSLIRGGYNSFSIYFSDEPVAAPYNKIDIYVALSAVLFEREGSISSSAFVIGDLDEVKGFEHDEAKKINIPFKSYVKEIGANEIIKNSVAIGACVKILGLDFSLLSALLRESYTSEKIFKLNLAAAEYGYQSHNLYMDISELSLNLKLKEGIFLTGNESVCCGALTAGMNFYSTYPMTPASSILHILAQYEEDYGIIAKHAEDEIAGINMAIGASYAGARAMVGTSGGGFSLMVEGLGLAAMTELPLVIVESQRPGPATGMPTWNEQSDLKFILNASQDEFVRVVFAPGDVDEMFYAVFDAFNLADKFHVPAIVLSDKFLSESFFTTYPFVTDALRIDRGMVFGGDSEKPMDFFERYKEVKDGVGMISFPSTAGGLYKAPGNEHDNFGFVTDDGKNRKVQQERRFSKLAVLVKEMPKPKLYGKESAEMTFICWGSTKSIMSEALKYSNKFNFIHFNGICPIDWDYVKNLLNGRNLVIIENNFTAQLRDVIAEKTGILIERKFLKYDGRPFFVEEILDFVGGIK